MIFLNQLVIVVENIDSSYSFSAILYLRYLSSGENFAGCTLFVDLSQPINNEESKKIEIKDKKNKLKDKLISLENGRSNR